MPPGMLNGAAAEDGAAAEPLDDVAKVRIARGKKSGEWMELQAATPGEKGEPSAAARLVRFKDDSRFLAPAAFTLLHAPFAKALPGFDAFQANFFSPAALARLAAELETFAREVAGVDNAAAAKTSLAGVSDLVARVRSDEEWRTLRDTLVKTMRDIASFATELSKSDRGLWVVAP